MSSEYIYLKTVLASRSIIALAGFMFVEGFSVVSQTHPNNKLLVTDDQRWDALGHAGNQIILTSNMDQLAREGAYFSNAFVITTICAGAAMIRRLQQPLLIKIK